MLFCGRVGPGGTEMTVHTQSMAARLSKFTVGDLALRSALQLERARAGIPYDKSQLTALADALRVSTGLEDRAATVSYMRPGYFEPFERVYRSHHDSDPKSYEDVRRYVIDTIEDIDAATERDTIGDTVASTLVDFCLELNREFVRRRPTENRSGRRQRSVEVEAFIC